MRMDNHSVFMAKVLTPALTEREQAEAKREAKRDVQKAYQTAIERICAAREDWLVCVAELASAKGSSLDNLARACVKTAFADARYREARDILERCPPPSRSTHLLGRKLLSLFDADTISFAGA